MASFTELMMKARKRHSTDTKETNKRFREILEIVRKHKVTEGLSPQKAVAILEDLGPTFVKLGQIASTHPDMLPVEYCQAFGQLRAEARPLPAEEARKKIEDELGAPIDELFSEFDDEPVGSASIAQVHRAVLADGGQEVAVKVQRPGVVETVTNDLAILERLSDLYEMTVRGSDGMSLERLVDELVRTSNEELDFTIEAGNLDRFYRNNEGREGVSCPRCYPKYSNEAILTEDFASSPRIGAIDSMGLSAEERKNLGYLIANNYVVQVLDDGFFHADPHAGNILVTKDKGIEWIDFGMMGSLTTKEREVLLDMVGDMVKGNAYQLKHHLLSVVTPTGPVDHGALLAGCEKMIDDYANSDLESFDTGKLFDDALRSLQGAGFNVAPFLVTLGRGLVTLEGTIALVSRDVNIMHVMANYISRIAVDPHRMVNKVRQTFTESVESAEALNTLPSQASNTLDMLQKGHVKVGTELKVDRATLDQVTTALNSFSLVLVAAALIIGSSVLCLTSLEPQVFGVPLFGAIGFVCGVALVFYVFWRIAREKRK